MPRSLRFLRELFSFSAAISTLMLIVTLGANPGSALGSDRFTALVMALFLFAVSFTGAWGLWLGKPWARHFLAATISVALLLFILLGVVVSDAFLVVGASLLLLVTVWFFYRRPAIIEFFATAEH